ncbi:MAG: hypothetical protein IKF07_03650 [Eubacterium sp.]|nr:hypothetical protein [Eubacterium sp.]
MIKGLKKTTLFIITITLLFVMIGFLNAEQNYAATKKIHLSKKTVSLYVDDTSTQKLINKKGKTIKATKVKWKSANTAVAKISKKGKITAVKAGTTKMTAKYSGKTYKFTVKVNIPFKDGEKPTINTVTEYYADNKITVYCNTLKAAKQYELYVSVNGGEFVLYDTKYYPYFTYQNYTEETNYTFKVRGIRGNYYSEFSDEKSIFIKKKSITVDTDKVELKEGETKVINVTAEKVNTITYKANNSYVSCKWGEWSNNSIPLTITGDYPGETIITISDKDDSSVFATITVTVKSSGNTSVTVDENILSLRIGETKVINVYTDNGGGVFCRTSNGNVTAKWNGWIPGTNTDTLAITGVYAGKTTLTIGDSKNESIHTTVTVTVVPDIDVQAPYLPATYSYYNFLGGKESSCQINKVEFEYSSSVNDTYNIEVWIYGEKTYENKNSNVSDSCFVGYKLYDSEGYVVESGHISLGSMALGEKFKVSKYIASGVQAGEYRLELTDYK